jgi:hypothetical protein
MTISSPKIRTHGLHPVDFLVQKKAPTSQQSTALEPCGSLIHANSGPKHDTKMAVFKWFQCVGKSD